MLFFGAGTGRCGTATLANLLTAEADVVCLHEGQLRRGMTALGAWLPFLTLQNVVAYHHPERARELFEKARSMMPELAVRHGLRALGDVAYNNSPFVRVIPEVFPDARLIAIFRDGRDFVRSAYLAEGPDPAPVGWSNDDRLLDKRARFIAMGRLRPCDSAAPDSPWHRLTALEKNAWLWAETNRLILDGLEAWPEDQVRVLRFEEFFGDPEAEYARLRAFLGLEGLPPGPAAEILARRLNDRPHYVLPKWPDWDEPTRRAFERQAGPMMRRLGYADGGVGPAPRVGSDRDEPKSTA